MGKGQAPWISEMYGYVFAAAEAKLKHILTEGIVVYPDEIGAGRRAPQPKHSAASTGPKHRAPALSLDAHGPGTAPAPEPDPDAKPWSSLARLEQPYTSLHLHHISRISPLCLRYISPARLEEPYIIHYGLHCAVGSFRFTKYSYGDSWLGLGSGLG